MARHATSPGLTHARCADAYPRASSPLRHGRRQIEAVRRPRGQVHFAAQFVDHALRGLATAGVTPPPAAWHRVCHAYGMDRGHAIRTARRHPTARARRSTDNLDLHRRPRPGSLSSSRSRRRAVGDLMLPGKRRRARCSPDRRTDAGQRAASCERALRGRLHASRVATPASGGEGDPSGTTINESVDLAVGRRATVASA